MIYIYIFDCKLFHNHFPVKNDINNNIYKWKSSKSGASTVLFSESCFSYCLFQLNSCHPISKFTKQDNSHK